MMGVRKSAQRLRENTTLMKKKMIASIMKIMIANIMEMMIVNILK